MEATSPVESVDKALLALEALSKAAEGLSLGALATQLGLKRNSLHRTLAALRFRGFVVQEPLTGAYQLGPSLLRISEEYLSGSRLRLAFRPMLQSLAHDVNELCHVGMLEGLDIIHLDKVEPERAVRVWSSVGSRSAAVTTALGRAIVSFLYNDYEIFSRRFAGTIPQRTPNTITDPAALWAEMQITRIRGYAIENEEGQQGVSCVAVPVLRAGAPMLSVSVSAPSERMTGARIVELIAAIRRQFAAQLPVGLSLPPMPSEGTANQPGWAMKAVV